jgi:hypothetical protein
MVAPDTRMRPFQGWTRHECKTVAEVEQFSRRMARQEYQKFKTMRVEEHIRSQKKREEIKANCRLRLAKGCISAEDERLTRETLASLERKDQALYALIADQVNLDKACLTIEKQEESTSPLAVLNKRKGLSDEELSFSNRMAEATA